jgi:hypothetical protein
MERASFSDWRRSAVVLAAGVLVLAAFAPSGCGLSGDVDALFGSAQDNATSSGTGTTTATTTTASSGGGATSSSQSTTSGGGEGGATSSSRSSSSGGGEGGAVTSTSSGPVSMIDCGMVECPQGGDNACCWDEHQFSEPPYGVCVDMPPGDCNTAIEPGGVHTRISCQTQEHCPGMVCCAQRDDFPFQGNQIFYYVTVTCQNACDYNQDQRILCDPVNPSCPMADVNGMPVQLVCVNSALLPMGYGVCATP